jgi:hypothetical protein
LEFVGTSDPNPPDGAGYGGPPLPERYPCAKGCSRPMKAIGSIFDADDEEMRLHEPYVSFKMTKAQSDEWRQLIEAAGLVAAPQGFALRDPALLIAPPIDLVFRIRTPGIPVREVRIQSASVTIGNDPSAHLTLDGDDMVSRMHVLVELCALNELVVFDLGSRTGTWINGKRIISNARLESGGVLKIGATMLEVEIVPCLVG